MQAAPWSRPSGTLGDLVAAARRRVEALRGAERDLARRAAGRSPGAPFAEALRRPDVAVIAEVKRSSPSRGSINPGMDAAARALAYAAGGAAAVSVLTEPDRFGGSAEDLEAVRARIGIPLLRKDFLVHPLQLLETRALGASAALLIVRALAPEELVAMAGEARGLGLEILVEVRDETELERALALDAMVIGINNRNLETLRVDPSTVDRLLPRIPADCVAVAESGMSDRGDVEAAGAAGADAVLVGSALSGSADPESAVRSLVGVVRTGRPR